MKTFGLSKDERIKSKKDFDEIFSSGKVLYSSDNLVKLLYVVEKNSTSPGVKMAPAVNKKAGNAVWRNRVKRLIKESYRLNKLSLVQFSVSQGCLFKLVFSINRLNKKNYPFLKLNDLMPGIKDLLDKVKCIS